MPQHLDGRDLGEEPVPADVESPAVALDGTADPADHVVGFEHRDGRAASGQLIGACQASRPGTNDHRVRNLSRH